MGLFDSFKGNRVKSIDLPEQEAVMRDPVSVAEKQSAK